MEYDFDQLEHAQGVASRIPHHLAVLMACDEEEESYSVLHGWLVRPPLVRPGVWFSAGPKTVDILLGSVLESRNADMALLLAAEIVGADHTRGWIGGRGHGPVAGSTLEAATLRIENLYACLRAAEPNVRAAAAVAIAQLRHSPAHLEQLCLITSKESCPVVRSSIQLAISTQSDGLAGEILRPDAWLDAPEPLFGVASLCWIRATGQVSPDGHLVESLERWMNWEMPTFFTVGKTQFPWFGAAWLSCYRAVGSQLPNAVALRSLVAVHPALCVLIDQLENLTEYGEAVREQLRVEPKVSQGRGVHLAGLFPKAAPEPFRTVVTPLRSPLPKVMSAQWTPVRKDGKFFRCIHKSSQIPFIVVPGVMGLDNADMYSLARVMDLTAPLAAVLELRASHSQPVHEVSVDSFLVSERPLSVAELSKVISEELPDRLVDRATACKVALGHGLRLPSEAELEWLVRDGVQAAFVQGLLDESQRAAVLPPHREARSRFGVTELSIPHWVADDWHDCYLGAPTTSEAWLSGGREGVIRGDFLSTSELGAEGLLSQLCAARRRGAEHHGAVRLAWSLPGVK